MHELSMREDGTAEFAYVGEDPWHKLGQKLKENASIEEWQKQAGMDWSVRDSKVTYYANTDRGWKPDSVYPNRKILYRGDNGESLSIVSDDFKIVQPKEVLEFFRDLISSHRMKMETAGCLFGGRRFWALANTSNFGEVIPHDPIKSHLLFVTSVDGTLATCAKFVSTRVVCNNTMQIAMRENAARESIKTVVRKTHKSIWDNTQAHIDLGLLETSFTVFLNDLKTLSERKMSDKEVKDFFKKTFFDPEKEEQSGGAIRKVNTAMNCYFYGPGSKLAYGSAYGAFNAITDMLTHGAGRKSLDKQFWDAYYESNKIKDITLQSLLGISL